MALRNFLHNEALAVVQGLANVDHELGPGRDLFYEIETVSGQVVHGLIVTQDDDSVTLADVRTPDNNHNEIDLGDIASVLVRSYT